MKNEPVKKTAIKKAPPPQEKKSNTKKGRNIYFGVETGGSARNNLARTMGVILYEKWLKSQSNKPLTEKAKGVSS